VTIAFRQIVFNKDRSVSEPIRIITLSRVEIGGVSDVYLQCILLQCKLVKKLTI